MDKVQLRRENLRKWTAQHGTPSEERSYFSQLINGSSSFGEKSARRLERDYRMGDMYLDSPTNSGTSEQPLTTPPPAPRVDTKKSHVSAVHPDDTPLDDFVYVPESKIEFSAGNGRAAMYELIEDEEPATYRLSWFQKYGINPNRVRRFRVSGDSMEPLLFARDTILVNQDETTVVDGRLYAIRYGEELRVKYLSRRLDGTLVLRSVNPQYKDEEVSPEMVGTHITVIGRVRDRSGTGGL
jgi:phage repressor protein C with HTH and peptisase S24 domain